MGLELWTRKTKGGLVVKNELVDPLRGNGSLHLADANDSTAAAANLYLTTFGKGFTKGQIRSIIQFDSRPITGTDHVGAGFVFMQSILDISNSNGNFYYLGFGGFEGVSTPGSQELVLYKKTASQLGVTTGWSNVLYQTTIAVSAGDFFPLQVFWEADIAKYNGTRYRISIGTLNSLNFNTLTPLIDTTDTSSPLLTSVAEGIAMSKPDTVNSTAVYFLDDTTIYRFR